MINWLQRAELLVGEEGIEKLKNANVLVVGLGGVGSFAAEFLCRSGIGRMTIIDGDEVDPTNKNRQLVALDSTVGMNKADVMAARMRDINPDIQLTIIKEFLSPERMNELVTKEYDWVVDCIDSLQPKQYFLVAAINNGVNVASSMGAGGRMDTEQVHITNLFKTKNCPFAHQVRKGLRRKGIKKADIIAVYSEELVNKDTMQVTDGSRFKKSYYGTISYIPALFGLHIASIVIRRLLDETVKFS